MTNEQLEVQLAAFAARQQVHRQLIGWFVANFVNQDDDPAESLKTVSETLSRVIDEKSNQRTIGLATSEAMHAELDAVVLAARRALRKPEAGSRSD